MAYPRRRGRKPLTALAVLGLVGSLLLVSNTVLAVHDEGVFQLDGNAITAGEPNNTDNPLSITSGAHDWDQVYHDCLANNPNINNPTTGINNCFGTANTSGSTNQTFVTDFTALGDSILTGGSTKDINDLPGNWLWKQTSTTSVQDKDDIEHAFAAAYTANVTRCGSITSGDALTNCKLLYFGADRFSNSGNTTMGFWFFKGPVGLNPLPNPLPTGGTSTFTGQHTARTIVNGQVVHGDILIVVDFLTGGAAPTVSIYEWVASGGNTTTHLDLIGGGTSSFASCTQAPNPQANKPPVPPTGLGDNFCATVNQDGSTGTATVISPWPFTPKPNTGGIAGAGGTAAFGISEFMEGGINMTALGLGNECFSTFMAETRASSSPTSTLSDFALGGFGQCGSSTVTTPESSSGTALTDTNGNGIPDVSIGSGSVQVKDHAAVSVTGTSTWTGTVSFSLCGPLDLTSSTTCSTGGTAITPPATVSNSQTTGDSALTTLTSVGRYCWRADFTSGTTGVPASSDGSSGECFEVLPVQPSLVTQVEPTSGTVTLGSTISDTATLSGTARQPGTNGIGPGGTINATNGAAAGGTISWTVQGPNSCTTTAFTPNSATVSGDGDYTSGTQTPTAVGQYVYVASYSGSSPNTLGVAATACTSQPTAEKITVGSSSTLTTPEDSSGTALTDHNANGLPDVSIGTGSVQVKDHAVVTVTGGITTWSGTVSFHLCGPADLTSNTNCRTGGASITPPQSVSNLSTSADSALATLTSVGRYCWRADFTSATGGVPPSADPPDATSSSECFEVLPVQPTLVTQVEPTSGTIILGNSMSDTATLTGTANQPGTNGIGGGGSINATNGAPAGGQISWTVFGPNSCTTTAFGPVTASVSGDGDYTSGSFTPTKLGVYVFVASYNGSSPNTLSASTGDCASQPQNEKITVNGNAHLSTAQDWLPNDTATLTGDANLNGTLTFTLYNDASCGSGGGTVQYGPVSQTITDATSGSTFHTNNTTYKVTAASDSSWSWLVHYVDSNLTSPTDSCEYTTIHTIHN
ncbi:MAG TPA: hypothetical protein VF802_07515 [Candidatus Limnocylindrales bacterium]